MVTQSFRETGHLSCSRAAANINFAKRVMPQNKPHSPIRSFVTAEDHTYYRVFSGDRNVGSFLTGAPPASADRAVAGLALPPANTAEFIQEVMVPAGTRLQSSLAAPAFGQPGGMLQFELLERIPIKNFGEGMPFG